MIVKMSLLTVGDGDDKRVGLFRLSHIFMKAEYNRDTRVAFLCSPTRHLRLLNFVWVKYCRNENPNSFEQLENRYFKL